MIGSLTVVFASFNNQMSKRPSGSYFRPCCDICKISIAVIRQKLLDLSDSERISTGHVPKRLHIDTFVIAVFRRGLSSQLSLRALLSTFLTRELIPVLLTDTT